MQNWYNVIDFKWRQIIFNQYLSLKQVWKLKILLMLLPTFIMCKPNRFQKQTTLCANAHKRAKACTKPRVTSRLGDWKTRKTFFLTCNQRLTDVDIHNVHNIKMIDKDKTYTPKETLSHPHHESKKFFLKFGAWWLFSTLILYWLVRIPIK